MGRRMHTTQYLTLDEAVEFVERIGVEYPNLDEALLALRREYTNTPSYLNDSALLNIDGLRKLEYAAGQVAVEAMNQLVLEGGLTWLAAVSQVHAARKYQMEQWSSLVEPDRSFEEWILLTEEYQHRFKQIFANGQGSAARLTKYAAIVANLALWAVQSALGHV